MFEVNVNGRKQRYRSKPTMNVDTTGSSGNVSIPKPLTYDYMPEGYPKKVIGAVTLMEEQEVAFTDSNGVMTASISIDFEITYGDILTVVWDGISYDVVVKKVTAGPNTAPGFGNLGLLEYGDTTEHPFLCAYVNGIYKWATADTAATHTIKVMRPTVKYTPIDANYMPEGYPKKDGWSVEWDGNIDGKTSAVGAPLYKFSDRGLSYEEFLRAKLVNPSDSSQFIMVSAMHPKQEKVSDAISVFSAGDLQIYVISEDTTENVEYEIIFPTKGLYTNQDAEPFKLTTETITPMSTDFIPPMKNLNVVFNRGSSSSIPDSCNVTYDELRGWIENGIPVFAAYKSEDDKGSVGVLMNIMQFVLNADSLMVYYQNRGSTDFFKYNPDGTFSGSGGVES